MSTLPAGTGNTGEVTNHTDSFQVFPPKRFTNIGIYAYILLLCYNQIMDDDKILEITSSIEETLGHDNFATISDKIGELLTGNSENMKALADRDAEIDKLRDRNEKLVAANGALLQRVPMEYKRIDRQVRSNNSESKEETKKISYKDIFDTKGNFLR